MTWYDVLHCKAIFIKIVFLRTIEGPVCCINYWLLKVGNTLSINQPVGKGNSWYLFREVLRFPMVQGTSWTMFSDSMMSIPVQICLGWTRCQSPNFNIIGNRKHMDVYGCFWFMDVYGFGKTHILMIDDDWLTHAVNPRPYTTPKVVRNGRLRAYCQVAVSRLWVSSHVQWETWIKFVCVCM